MRIEPYFKKFKDVASPVEGFGCRYIVCLDIVRSNKFCFVSNSQDDITLASLDNSNLALNTAFTTKIASVEEDSVKLVSMPSNIFNKQINFSHSRYCIAAMCKKSDEIFVCSLGFNNADKYDFFVENPELVKKVALYFRVKMNTSLEKCIGEFGKYLNAFPMFDKKNQIAGMLDLFSYKKTLKARVVNLEKILSLTEKERLYLKQFLEGKTLKSIGLANKVTPSAVWDCMDRIKEKTNCASKEELVRLFEVRKKVFCEV